MFLTNTASLVQLHLLEGYSMIRVTEFLDEFGDYEGLRDHLLAYEGVEETDNRDVLSLKDCYKQYEKLKSWEVVDA